MQITEAELLRTRSVSAVCTKEMWRHKVDFVMPPAQAGPLFTPRERPKREAPKTTLQGFSLLWVSLSLVGLSLSWGLFHSLRGLFLLGLCQRPNRGRLKGARNAKVRILFLGLYREWSRATRWTTTLSSEVNLNLSITFRAMRGANLVTYPADF